MTTLVWNRRLLITLAGVVAVMLACLAALPFLIDVDRIKGRVISEIETQLRRKVTVRKASLTLFTGLGADLEGVAISEDPQFGPLPFFSVASIKARVGLLRLLTGRIDVASLEFVRPALRLVKGKGGNWNYESLASQKAVSETGARPTAPAEAAMPIRHLRFRDGSLSLIDQTQSDPQESRFESINVDLQNLSSRQPVRFECGIQLPRTSSRSLQMSGTLGTISLEDPKKIDVDGILRLTEAPLAGLLALGGTVPGSRVSWSGTVSTNSKIKGSLDQGFQLEGETRFSSLSAKHPSHTSPPLSGDLAYNLWYQPNPGNLKIARGELKMKSSEIEVLGTVTREAESSRYGLKLASRQVAIEDLLKLASLLGHGPPEGVSADGVGLLEVLLQGTNLEPRLEGTSRFGSLRVRYPGLEEPIQISNFALQFEQNRISTQEMVLTVGDRSRLKANVSVTLGPKGVVQVQASTQNPLQVNDLVAIGSSFGVNLPEGFSLEGGLLNFQAQGRKPWAGETATLLDGEATIAGSKVRAPILKVPLEVRRATLKFRGESVEMTGLAASLGTTNLSGSMAVAGWSAPRLSFQLGADQLDLGHLEQIFELNGTSASGPGAVRLRKPPIRLPIQTVSADSPRAGAKPVALARLTVSDSRLAVNRVRYDQLLLTDLSTRVAMKRMVLELDNLKFKVHQGTQEGNATIDISGPEPRYSFQSQVRNVDANELLSANSSLKNVIYGRLSSNLALRGHGSGYDNITRNLKGDGKITLTGGRITAFSISEQMATLGRLAGLSVGEGETKIENLETTFEISDGRIQAQSVQARLPDAVVRAVGSIGFDKTLDFRMAAELAPTLSQKYDDRTQFLNLASATFFKNKQGQVVVPLRLTGEIEHPRFALDTAIVRDNLRERFKSGVKGAVDALQNLLKPKSPESAGEPAGSRSASPEEKSTVEKEQQKEERKESPLEDFFRDLGEKLKKKQ
ncbi:MAG: AsmA family protein [Acidobacteriota bacterium]